MRISILEVLALDGGRILSPSDLSLELQMPLANVNYHVTELLKAELVEEAFRRRVRGATEHFYRMAPATPERASARPRARHAGSYRSRRRTKIGLTRT